MPFKNGVPIFTILLPATTIPFELPPHHLSSLKAKEITCKSLMELQHSACL